MSVRLDASLEDLRRKRGAKWTEFGEEMIPAWVADMDFPIAAPVRQAMLDVIEREDLGYAGTATLADFDAAFVERMTNRFGWEPRVRRVMPIGDLIQSMFSTITAYCEPGEGVVIQTPIYYPFLQVVDAQKRRLVDNPLVPASTGEERDEIDLDGLRDVIDEGTRMILFCNPHNPTGRVFERRELEGVAEIALERDLIVVSDEVHSDLAHSGRSHIPFASLSPEVEARTVTLTSATKAFNIAGLRCALMHFGSKELKDHHDAAFHPRLLGTPNNLGIEATMAAWRKGDEWLEAVVAQLDANRRRVADFLAERLPEVVYHPPEASYFAWLDCTALGLPARPYDFFMAESGVAMSDGQAFSPRCGDFVRVNLATTPEILTEILERMTLAVERAVGDLGARAARADRAPGPPAR